MGLKLGNASFSHWCEIEVIIICFACAIHVVKCDSQRMIFSFFLLCYNALLALIENSG